MPPTESVQDRREPVALQEDVDQGITPGEIFRMLWRHKLFILLCTLVCFALAFVYVRITRSVYEATATVRIDPGRTGSLGLGDLGSGGSSDTSSVVHTEMAIMESDGVALRTLRDMPDNEFSALTGEAKNEAALPDTVQALTPEQSDLLGTIQGSLTIKQQEGTSLINLSFRNPNPKLAAAVVNRLVSAYFVQSFVDRDRSVSQLDDWLASQMTSLKKQVDAAERQLTGFEERNNVIPTEGNASNSIFDRLRELSDRLTTAQSERIVKEGQLRAAQTSDVSSLAALFPTSRLQALQGEQASISGRYQQLHAKFGANYPPLIEVDKQLKVVNGEISEEIQSIHNRLQEEYNAAKTTEDLLRQEYKDQTSLAFAFDRHEAEYAVLQAEVTSSRALYDTLRRDVQQAGINAQVNGLNTMAVDYAFAPSYPVAPKRTLILGAALVLGLFAGMAAALLLEAGSDHLHTVAQLGKAAPYPVIGTIPAESASRHGAEIRPLIVTGSGLSRTAEAYRTLRNVVLLRAMESPFKSVLMAAPTRTEHVSEVAANTAMALAQANKRVLLVDADLQEPSLHRYFGVENGSGLGDLLSGVSSPGAYRQPVPEYNGLALLTAGTTALHATDPLIQEPFENMLREWRGAFDFVLIKAAPLLEQSSGLLLAHWIDRMLVVARYQESQLRTFRELSPLLNHAGAQVLGVVVENAPPSK